MKELSKRIKIFRKKLKLSQRKFSQKFSLSNGYISKFERGLIKNPGVRLRKKLIKIIISNKK